MSVSRRVVAEARNALLYNIDGSRHIDLFAANGTLLLGHCCQAINEQLIRQCQRIWISGRLETDTRLAAKAAIERMIPADYYLSGLYSTGMEAAEFALRAVRVLTKRKDVIGFARGMHGKSMATAFLAWDNPFGYPLPGIIRLPFPDATTAPAVLAELDGLLARGETAAVFIEAIQGSGGGVSVDVAFGQALTALCRRHRTLLVADEILTGFFRTGPLFFFQRCGLEPDVILAGKCMGNGFPVSAVLLRRGLEVTPAMLPFSTYAENALAAAAVVATLQELERLPLAAMIAAVEAQLQRHLERSASTAMRVTIWGALCIIDTSDASQAQRIADACYERGVLISQAGSILRLLPPITIEPSLLEQALAVLVEAIAEQMP